MRRPSARTLARANSGTVMCARRKSPVSDACTPSIDTRSTRCTPSGALHCCGAILADIGPTSSSSTFSTRRDRTWRGSSGSSKTTESRSGAPISSTVGLPSTTAALTTWLRGVLRNDSSTKMRAAGKPERVRRRCTVSASSSDAYGPTIA